MTTKLDRPVVIDLIALEEVEVAVDAAECELVQLEARVATARATAERLEAQLRSEGADPDTAAWMVVRCRQFVQELLWEAEEEAQVVVAQAHRVAAMRTGTESPWLAGALAVRPRRPSPEPAVRWRAPEPAPATVPIGAPVALAAPSVSVTESARQPVVEPELEVAVDAPDAPDALDALDAPDALDATVLTDLADLSRVDAEPSDEAAPQLERDFWPAARETAPFWKRRPKVTVATTLTVSAGFVAVAAVAVQLV